jgi:predicted nucleic acid-binding protein
MTCTYVHVIGEAMEVIVDASVLIAVILNEEEKEKLVKITDEIELVAPLSVHWEIGNALSSLLKRRRIVLEDALAAIDIYLQIPVRFVEVELAESIELTNELDLYAYDAYLLRCAAKYRLPLLTLDHPLREAAKKTKVEVLEV